MEAAFLGMAIASGGHLIEEYIYPGGFPAWMRSVFPRSAPGTGPAIVINAAFFSLVLSPLISDPQTAPIFNLSIAGLLLVNGAVHVVGTFWTGRYSPGAITSVFLYFPSALYTLIVIPHKWRMGAVQVVLGILLGFVWQMIPLAFVILRRWFKRHPA